MAELKRFALEIADTKYIFEKLLTGPKNHCILRKIAYFKICCLATFLDVNILIQPITIQTLMKYNLSFRGKKKKFSHVTIERFRITFTENGKLQLHIDNF